MKSTYRRKTFEWIDWAGTIIYSCVALLVLALGAYNYAHRVENAEEALTQKGFTSVKVGKWYPWCWTRTIGSRFTAVDSQGKVVQGTICQTSFYNSVDIATK